jgi:hypothetical protein
MSTDYMLSTKDNPYNPWTQWDDWLSWDTHENYNSLSLLARVAVTTNGENDQLDDLAMQDAIDEIVKENVSGVHIKVPKPSDEKSD